MLSWLSHPSLKSTGTITPDYNLSIIIVLFFYGNFNSTPIVYDTGVIMKNLRIDDRIFDPEEIEFLELIGNIICIHYRFSGIVSRIRFQSREQAATEYYTVPDLIKKSIRKA